jgi:hypothetical protein
VLDQVPRGAPARLEGLDLAASGVPVSFAPEVADNGVGELLASRNGQKYVSVGKARAWLRRDDGGARDVSTHTRHAPAQHLADCGPRGIRGNVLGEGERAPVGPVVEAVAPWQLAHEATRFLHEITGSHGAESCRGRHAAPLLPSRQLWPKPDVKESTAPHGIAP